MSDVGNSLAEGPWLWGRLTLPRIELSQQSSPLSASSSHCSKNRPVSQVRALSHVTCVSRDALQAPLTSIDVHATAMVVYRLQLAHRPVASVVRAEEVLSAMTVCPGPRADANGEAA